MQLSQRNPNKRHVRRGLVLLLLPLAALLTAGAAVVPGSGDHASASSGTTISFSYSPAYIFDTPALANQWYAMVKQQWHALHPNVRLNPIPISGSYNDIVTKEALDFRSPSTTPDITLIQTAAIAQFATAGYLLPLNSYLKSANPSWWRGFPSVVKSEADIKGQIYGVDTVEHDRSHVLRARLQKGWYTRALAPQDLGRRVGGRRKDKGSRSERDPSLHAGRHRFRHAHDRLWY